MLTGVVVFMLLLIALLAIPMALTFKVSWLQTFEGQIKLQWLFGLIRIQIPPLQLKQPSEEGEKLVQKIDRLERLPPKKNNFLAIIRQKAFRQRIIRFSNDLWRAIHKRNVFLRIRIGLGDPADTGKLWAVVGPVAGILANVQDVSIKIEPEFFDTTFELDSSGNIRLIPLQIIYLTVGLLLSRPIWQGIKLMRVVE